MSDPILEVVDLKKRYGDVQAVDGVSFFIPRGSVCAILGPNGAGKTTTIEIIEGLRVKDSGIIKVFGRQVDVIGQAEKEKIGVQLQETSFFPHLNVEEILKLYQSFYSKTITIEEALGISMLEEKKKSYVDGLSGGQRQRLALALALINDPEIVFLDEPTTGLDPQARRSVWESIQRLKDSGKTIILTTHYMEEAEVLADHILILDHGKIISEGTMADLISKLDMRSFVRFEVAGEDLPDITQFPDMPNMKQQSQGIYAIETNDFLATLHSLTDTANSKGLILKNVNIRQPNLEDVFLYLTGRTLRE